MIFPKDMSGDEGAGTSQQSSGQESAQFLATEIKGLPCFNPRDDPNTLSIRWKRFEAIFTGKRDHNGFAESSIVVAYWWG